MKSHKLIIIGLVCVALISSVLFYSNSAFARLVRADDSSHFDKLTMKPEDFELPEGYSDRSVWSGFVEIDRETLVNLGLMEYGYPKYKVCVDGVLSEFDGAAPEVMDILFDGISHLKLKHEDIIREQMRVNEMVAGIEPLESMMTQVDTLEHIGKLVSSFSYMMKVYSNRLGMLRDDHYYSKFWGRVGTYKRGWDHRTPVLLALGNFVGIINEIYELLPEDSTGQLRYFRDKIERAFSHPEIQAFLEKKEFLRFAELYFRFSSRLSGKDFSPYNFGGWLWDHMREIQKKVRKLDEYRQLMKEFHEIWVISQDKGGGPDKHSAIRSFPARMLKNVLAPLDYYSRLARMAIRGDYLNADISQPLGTVNIVSYRNPILGNVIEVTPVTISIDRENNALPLSGPNMGGKTTTARGITLAVLLNQMGLPLPLEHAELAVFKNIYSVFPHPEQLQAGHGYFSYLVNQIVELTKKAGPGDLVVLDEVPTGTEYTELVAIATVLVEDLINTGATVIVTGHLKKAFELIAEHTGIQPYMHTVSEGEDGQIEPDFGIEPGIAKMSYAIELMSRAGFPNDIVELARAYYKIITEEDVEVDFPEINTSRSPMGGPEAIPEDFKLVASVIRNLYYDDNFAFGTVTQDIIVNTIAESIQMREEREKLMETLEGFRMDDVEKEKEMIEGEVRANVRMSSEERFQTTEAYLGQGKEYLEKLTVLLEKFSELRHETSFVRMWQREFDYETSMANLDFLKPVIKNIKKHLSPLKEESRTKSVVEAMEELLTHFDKLKEKYTKANRPDLNREQSKKLLLDWQSDWQDVLQNIFRTLLIVDEYTGVARSIIEFGLKKPKFSEESNIFSLQGSIPFFPDKSSFFGSHWRSDPFIKDPVAQSFSINPKLPVAVITGPNSSGKSMLMFNSWVNILFAAHGFYVSGDLIMSNFDGIFSFFGGMDKPLVGESYFFNLLNKYAEIIRQITPNSIVILDELHGSDNFELAAIQLAVLHYLKAMNCTAIFNTHIRDGLKLLTDKVGIDFWQTDVEFDEETNNINPLYTLSPDPNLEAKSYGLAVAKPYLTVEQVKRIEEIIRLLKEESMP